MQTKFPIGSRIYYTDYSGKQRYGTVIDVPEQFRDRGWAMKDGIVWAFWEDEDTRYQKSENGYMPLDRCFSSMVDVGDLEDDL